MGGEGRVGPDPVYFHLWIGEKLRRHIVKRKLQIALLVYRTSGKSWGFYESRIFQGANHVSRWFTNSWIMLFFLKNSRFTCQKPSSTKSTFPLQLHGRTGYGNENSVGKRGRLHFVCLWTVMKRDHDALCLPLGTCFLLTSSRKSSGRKETGIARSWDCARKTMESF